MSVVVDFLIGHSISGDIIEDHRFMGAASERFTHGKEQHGPNIGNKGGKEIKHHKGEDVHKKGGHHRPASTVGICNYTGRQFKDVCGNFTNAEQHAYLKITNSHFSKKKYQIRVEKAQILHKTVKGKFPELKVL